MTPARGAVHDAIARMPGWAVGSCTYHGEVALWHVAAIGLHPHWWYAKREAITRQPGRRSSPLSKPWWRSLGPGSDEGETHAAPGETPGAGSRSCHQRAGCDPPRFCYRFAATPLTVRYLAHVSCAVVRQNDAWCSKPIGCGRLVPLKAAIVRGKNATEPPPRLEAE